MSTPLPHACTHGNTVGDRVRWSRVKKHRQTLASTCHMEVTCFKPSWHGIGHELAHPFTAQPELRPRQDASACEREHGACKHAELNCTALN